MKKLILISLLIAFSAQARLFDTKAQCLRRYGTPIKGNGNDLVFKKGIFNIRTIFINGKCEFIHYDKMKLNSGRYEAFTQLQISDILSINLKQKFNRAYNDKYQYISADKSIFAGLSYESVPRTSYRIHRLIITTLNYRRDATKGL